VVGSPVVYGKAQGEIEVTIVEGSIPAYTQLMAAHQSSYRLWIERLPEEVEIILVKVLSPQLASKPSDGHIRDRKEASKSDAKPSVQFSAIVSFEGQLRRRQKGSPGL
jgi:hypothetical protein